MSVTSDPNTHGRTRLSFASVADIDEFVATLERYALAEIRVSERDILDGIALAAAELPTPEEGAAPPGAFTCC